MFVMVFKAILFLDLWQSGEDVGKALSCHSLTRFFAGVRKKKLTAHFGLIKK